MADKFLVIDGSSLIHRAFFALPPLTTQSGVHTGAVYGFCNMLLRLLADVQPKWLAVAFDKSRKTFRTEMFADYKGQRKPTPSELSEQFPLARKVLEAMNIAVLELDNYEADDIIGTFAVHAPQEADVIIVTGDRDELQLLSSRTSVYFTKRGISDLKIYTPEVFAEEYEGLEPKQLIDLKGLMGDTSDNIPGIPGVGPKTALKLIGEYGSVENVLANADKISGKALREKVQNNKESALLSKKLATIFTDVPVDADLANYELKALKPEARELLAGLEFRNMYDRFNAVMGAPEGDFSLFGDFVEDKPAGLPEEIVKSADDAEALFKLIAVRREVTPLTVQIGGTLPDLYFKRAELLCDGRVYIFEGECPGWQQFYDWLADENCQKACCDSKEIIKTALCIGVEARGITDDIAIAAYLIDPARSEYSIKTVGGAYLTQEFAQECKTVFELVPVLRAKLAEHEQIKLYEEMELPLARTLAKMELAGIKPDAALLDKLTKEIAAQIAALEILAVEQAGESFNLKSTKQLGAILFEKLGLPVIKKTKTGYSTDVSVLEQLRNEHPLVRTILEHRKLTKLHSTYLEGLRPLINSVTGRIHTHFQQLVTVTGRLSSTDPNLQNIPTRTELGKKIREIFVPGEGYDYLLSCDYSQVELRVLAHIAQDELLLESFLHGQDVHARTAAEVFGVPLNEVTGTMRTRAKAVNFGIVYGISDFGLAKQLDINRGEAGRYIENYLGRYTGVKKYMDDMVASAKKQGYVQTLFGRRRYLPDINSRNFNLRGFAERTAINTPIQGTAADIIKIAMVNVQKMLEQGGYKSRILLQVHDELLLEVTEAEREEVGALVKQTMESAVKLSVPLIADVNYGVNWADAK